LKSWAALTAMGILLLSGCLAVGPSGPYRNAQLVDLSITQFDPGDTVWLSECAPGQTPSPATGCTPSRTGQQAVKLDRQGSGSARFRVASRVAGTNCAGYCAIVATNGKRVQSQPISFVAKGRVDIATGFDAEPVSTYINGKFFYTNQNGRGMPAFDATPGIYRFAFYAAGRVVAATSLTVRAGQSTSLVVYRPVGTRFSLIQTLEPPPTVPGKLRISIVNATPVKVTPTVDGITGSAIGAGRSANLLVNPPAGVANGRDSVTLTYPALAPATTPCPAVSGGGAYQRGRGYVLTVVYAQQGTSTCPYLIGQLVQGGNY
jgi:hypothetical protein